MKSYEKSYLKKRRNHEPLTSNNNFDEFFSSINNNNLTDLTLNENYKKFYMNQIMVQLDSKMLALIAKLNEDKIFENLKSQFDEDKKILLDKTSKKLKHSNSEYFIYNRLNLRNFTSKLNNNYAYDAADNLFMHSFFDKIKTRKRRVFKKKRNYYIDVLYQGSSSSKENILKMKRQKPKFDYRLLLKSSSDLEAYFKRRESDLIMKKLNSDNQFSVEDVNKEETNEINKTKNCDTNKNEPIEYFKNKTKYKLIKSTKGKNANFNFPNIKIKKKFDFKQCDNIDLVKEDKLINNSKEKQNNQMIISDDKNEVKMELSKNSIINITYLNKEKEKEKEKKISSLPKKLMSKTTTSRFLKDKGDNTIKFRLNENERIQYMNQLYKHKCKEVLTNFSQEGKNIEQKSKRINKLIINLKNETPQQNKDQKLINANKDILSPYISQLKNMRLYKVWNAATSLFHFPLINNIIYENNKNLDGIDKIKTNLKEEYLNKLKRNKKGKIKKIDGKIILKTLKDKYIIEKLKDIANNLREKQRKKEQFEVYEL